VWLCKRYRLLCFLGSSPQKASLFAPQRPAIEGDRGFLDQAKPGQPGNASACRVAKLIRGVKFAGFQQYQRFEACYTPENVMPEGTFYTRNPRAPQLHEILDVEAQLKPLPIEAMRLLARHFTDSALNRRCRSERGARLRDLAQTYEAEAALGRDVALLMLRDLDRYAASAWRFEWDRLLPVGTPERRQLQHRILTLTDGWVPGYSTIRRALGGSQK